MRTSRWYRSLLGVSVVVTFLVVSLGFARQAHADPVGYLSPGMTVSRWNAERLGAGGELSFMWFPSRTSTTNAVGGFVQGELLFPLAGGANDENRPKGFRVSAGPQVAAGPFGLEIGVDYFGRNRVAGEAGALGLRVAPFFSMAFLYVSGSVAFLPLALDGGGGDTKMRPPGFAGGVTLGVKLPLLILGDPRGLQVLPSC